MERDRNGVPSQAFGVVFRKLPTPVMDRMWPAIQDRSNAPREAKSGGFGKTPWLNANASTGTAMHAS